MIEYNILDDPSRNVEYGVDYWCDQEGLPYTSPDWKGPGLQRVNTYESLTLKTFQGLHRKLAQNKGKQMSKNFQKEFFMGEKPVFLRTKTFSVNT